MAEQVWRSSRPRFPSAVVGPHFEQICREWVAHFAAPETCCPSVRLACYSGAGFTEELRDAGARGEVVLVDLRRLYGGE
ncbi:hypothetical protein ACWDZX_17625 [Streptomyces collinus]